MSFFYSCISSLLKSKSGQAASLRGTSCERRASCEDLQGIKKYNLSGGTERHRAFSGHLFFFFPFSTVNSQLQTALLNPESFPSFQNTLIILILIIIILQQQTQGISPSENIGDHVRIPLNSFRELTLISWNVSTYSPYQHWKKELRKKNDYEIRFLLPRRKKKQTLMA